jgi:hypothetical protein
MQPRILWIIVLLWKIIIPQKFFSRQDTMKNFVALWLRVLVV